MKLNMHQMKLNLHYIKFNLQQIKLNFHQIKSNSGLATLNVVDNGNFPDLREFINACRIQI